LIGRKWWVPWLWLSPSLLLLSVYLVYPTVDTLRRSFFDARSRSFVGLDNYRYVIENPQPFVSDTHSAILNNVLWLVVFTALTLGFGLIIAVLAGRVRYESIVKSAVFVPMAISFVAAAVIWRFMYAYNADIGTVNSLVGSLGGHPTDWLQNTGAVQRWLTDSGPATMPSPLQLNNFALIFVAVWIWTGFAVVVLSAGLKGVPTDVLEAARVDGASEWQVVRYVVLPHLLPTIVVVATTLIIQALKLFDLVWVMTGGRFKTDVIATLFFRETFLVGDFGVGSALATVLLLCVLPLTWLTIRRIRWQS
jgi:alpha-glucoside transport system permease protein